MNTTAPIELAPSQAPENCEPPAIAILTTGKVLIIPESVYADFPGVNGFTVAREAGRIILTPLPPEPVTLEEIHRQLAAQGVTEQDITEQDITDAVKWARGQKGQLPAAG